MDMPRDRARNPTQETEPPRGTALAWQGLANNRRAGILPVLLGSGEQRQAYLNDGEPPGSPSKWRAGARGKLRLAGPCNRGYLSSRKVCPRSWLYSSSPQLQAALGRHPADACPIDNPLLQPYPKLITEQTRSNTRPPRALTPSPASPGRSFFVPPGTVPPGSLSCAPGLFLRPVLAWQGLHSAADVVLFPWHRLCFPPRSGWRRGTTLEGLPVPASLGQHQPGTGTICQHHGFAWVAKGAKRCGRTERMPWWHCCSPCIHHDTAASISRGIFLHCGSARLVISGAEHVWDPKEMSPFCHDTHSAGAGAGAGSWPHARVFPGTFVFPCSRGSD